MMRLRRLLILLALLTAAATGVLAQRYYDRVDRRDVPDWELDPEFAREAFTFVRIQYSSGYGGRRSGRGGRGYGGDYYGRGGGGWATDYPDSDLNFSWRLHQLTSLEVNPEPLILELTDPRLVDYPFIYLIEPGRGPMVLSEDEVQALRQYLLNGGFLMVDDFWGQEEWYNFYREIKRVFPDREPVELPITHEIFRIVFHLKEKPQVPSIDVARYGRSQGITWERPDAREPHYKALYDDKGRMMAIICHNTDLGDGWEREGEDEWYFHEFSEKKAYPLGINIVFYAMTH